MILVVVDRLSKYAHFLPLVTNFTSSMVAAIFVKEIKRLHGIPRSIVSDMDRIFLSSFWREIFKLQGTKLSMSTAYHPQSDGQTEVVNRSLEMYLRCFTMDQPRTWTRFLDWAEYWYNTSYHTSAGMTPFEIVYGRLPPSIPRYILDSSKNDVVDRDIRQRDAILQQLRYNLERAQNRMKNIADKHRTDMEFKVGDLVWVRLQPYKQGSAKGGPSNKLSRRFYGPFPILERLGSVAYQLQLPSVTKIHPVFHVSLLKKFMGDPSLSPKDLPEFFCRF